MATNMNMLKPLAPGSKQQACDNENSMLPGDDCFYQYEIQDAQDKVAKRPAFFGHKVLAVSYGGKLQLFGKRGVTFLGAMEKCSPETSDTECNPAYTGTSWVRLTKVAVGTDGFPTITVSSAADWKMDDHIVVTSTDYLPSHSEEMVLVEDANGGGTFRVRTPSRA